MDFILKSGQVLSHRKPKLMISLESVIPFFNIYIWFRIKVKVYIILFYCLESTPYCFEILFYNWRFQFFINALFHWSANSKFQNLFKLDKLFNFFRGYFHQISMLLFKFPRWYCARSMRQFNHFHRVVFQMFVNVGFCFSDFFWIGTFFKVQFSFQSVEFQHCLFFKSVSIKLKWNRK